MLKFIGTGDLANVKLGNTSCYYKSENEILLIDIGVLNFKTLIESEILKEVNVVNIIITHSHPDHIGGLASTIYYLEYWLKIKNINIVVPNDLQKNDIHTFLQIQGVGNNEYNFINANEFKMNKIKSVAFDKIIHSNVKSFAVTINFEENKEVFVGDNNDVNFLTKSLESINKNDLIYTDVSSLDSAVHLNIETLINLVPESKRKNVVCMHFDNDEIKERLKKLGFKIAENENKNSN